MEEEGIHLLTNLDEPERCSLFSCGSVVGFLFFFSNEKINRPYQDLIFIQR